MVLLMKAAIMPCGAMAAPASILIRLFSSGKNVSSMRFCREGTGFVNIGVCP